MVAADDTASGVRLALRDIARTADGETSAVLVLGRYNKSRQAAGSGVEFNTVHRAKGTEADYVVVLDLTDDRWGFPSQIHDDPLLELVLPPTHGKAFAFAEERRLFYVALTRARNGTYLITDPNRPSGVRAGTAQTVRQPAPNRRTRPGYVVPALPQRPPRALRDPQDAALHQPTTLHPPSAALQQLPRRLHRRQRTVRGRMHQPRLRQAARCLPLVPPGRDRASTIRQHRHVRRMHRILLQTRMHLHQKHTTPFLTKITRHEARGAHWLRRQLHAGRSTSQSLRSASAKLSDDAPAEPQGM